MSVDKQYLRKISDKLAKFIKEEIDPNNELAGKGCFIYYVVGAGESEDKSLYSHNITGTLNGAEKMVTRAIKGLFQGFRDEKIWADIPNE